MAELTPQEVLEAVDNWSLLQINEFVEAFCEKYNVSASAPVAAVAAAPGAGEGAAAAAEQTEFTVVLKSAGAQKIKVIKELRAIDPSLGLKEAKELADSAPADVVKDVEKDEAEKVKKQLEDVGAEVEIK
ncbi:MAG: 50S ribosomal protein L7/L12 [Candidatus Sumerlaeia bacterium]